MDMEFEKWHPLEFKILEGFDGVGFMFEIKKAFSGMFTDYLKSLPEIDDHIKCSVEFFYEQAVRERIKELFFDEGGIYNWNDLLVEMVKDSYLKSLKGID